MQYQIDSKLKFGDRFYQCELYHQDMEDGGIIFDPYVFEEQVTGITLLNDGSVAYSSEPHFLTLEEAKKFCEEAYYDESLKLSSFEKPTFEWVENTRTEIDENNPGKEVELKSWNLVSMINNRT